MEKKKIIIFYNGRPERLNNYIEFLKRNLNARNIVHEYYIDDHGYHKDANIKTNNVEIIFKDKYYYLGYENDADIFVNHPSYMHIDSEKIITLDDVPDYVARIEEYSTGRGWFNRASRGILKQSGRYPYNGFASVTHTSKHIKIKKVIFNPPATIVVWEDDSKTVVKAQDGEIYDKEKGLAMAISKRVLGDRGKYYEVFKKWTGEEDGK